MKARIRDFDRLQDVCKPKSRIEDFILESRKPELKSLEGENPGFKILADLKILKGQNPKFKIFENQKPETRFWNAKILKSTFWKARKVNSRFWLNSRFWKDKNLNWIFSLSKILISRYMADLKTLDNLNLKFKSLLFRYLEFWIFGVPKSCI